MLPFMLQTTLISFPQDTFHIRNSFKCISMNVIYTIICKRCGVKFISKTGRQPFIRLREHLFDIHNLASKPVATLFNSIIILDQTIFPIQVFVNAIVMTLFVIAVTVTNSGSCAVFPTYSSQWYRVRALLRNFSQWKDYNIASDLDVKMERLIGQPRSRKATFAPCQVRPMLDNFRRLEAQVNASSAVLSRWMKYLLAT